MQSITYKTKPNQSKAKQSKTKLRSKPNNPVQSGIKSRWMQADNKVHWLLFEWNFWKRIERSEISKKKYSTLRWNCQWNYTIYLSSSGTDSFFGAI